MTSLAALKARSETAWVAPLNLMRGPLALAECLSQTLHNVRDDLEACKETMSAEEYTAALEHALFDFIPRRVTG